MYPNTPHKKLWYNADEQKERTKHLGFRQRKISFKSLIKNHVRQYCRMSTIHGLSHTVNSEYNTIERTFWMTVTIMSLSIGVLLSYLLLYRYSISPTIATMETYSYPSWKIPFPAVTLCNVNKVRKSSVRSIVENIKIKHVAESDIERYFKKIAALITWDNVEFSYTDIIVQENVLRYINGSIDDIMRMVSQPCSDLLVRCMWQGKYVNCGKIFQPSKSVEGYCCSFNYYPNDVKSLIADGQYIGGIGRKDGLTVIFDAHPEDYYSTSEPYFGVKVLIHGRDDFPETSILTEDIQPGETVSLAIDPYYVESTESVKNLKLSQRNCLFPNESLLSTNDYQQCMTECRVDTILAICNCIPFIYTFVYNISAVICDLKNAQCLYTNAAKFSNLLPNNVDGNLEIMCPNCLPECSEIIYTLYSSTSKLSQNNFSINLKETLIRISFGVN